MKSHGHIEAKLLQEEQREQEKRFEAEERKNQTRQLVADSILKMNEIDKEAAVDNDSDNGLPDDTDDVDDELEVKKHLASCSCRSSHALLLIRSSMCLSNFAVHHYIHSMDRGKFGKSPD